MTQTTTQHHTIASTHDRRHADAQTLPQDTERLPPPFTASAGFMAGWGARRTPQRPKTYGVISCIWFSMACQRSRLMSRSPV